MDTTELHFAVPQGVLAELVGIANHPVGHTTVTATSEFGNGLVAKISHFVKAKDFRRSLLWEKDAINQMNHPVRGLDICLNDGGFVDLDDARMGPAIQDLWMLLSGTEQEQQNQLNHLLEGYQTFCALPQDQLQLIEVLRTLRITHYTAWLSRRWQDPAFPHNFPWFTEDKYWEQQILILKEQFSALDIPQYKLNPL